MSTVTEHELNTEVLIIGAGGAGLRAAIAAREAGAEVLVASKMPRDAPNCTVRTAGYFSFATVESADELFRQVVHVGGFLNNQKLAEIFASETVTVIPKLAEYGVELEVIPTEGREPGLPGHQVLKNAPQGALGYGLTRPMRQVAEEQGVRFLDEAMAVRLIVADGRVAGAVLVDLPRERAVTVHAKAVVVATGGGAGAYLRNDNPPGQTGEGIAMAFEAGAELVDLECVSFQFPRDRMEDVFRIDEVPDESLLKLGAAHYFLGGVRIDENCATNVRGLYAAGEVTGGVFGAARLGGAAMADTIVFGARSGKVAAEYAAGAAAPLLDDSTGREVDELLTKLRESDEQRDSLGSAVRETLWRQVGNMKNRDTLAAAAERLEGLQTDAIDRARGQGETLREALEALHTVTIGRLVATASLEREETRGSFWRVDFPQPDNENCLFNTVLSKAGDSMAVRREPVVMARLTEPTEPQIGPGCFGYGPRKAM